MKTLKFYMCLLKISLLTLLLIGCSNKTNELREATFSTMFPNVEMNSQAKFWIPKDKFKTGDSVELTLENISSEDIVFQADPLIFIFNGNEWLPVEDGLHFPQPRKIKIPPKNESDPSILPIVCWPQLQNHDETVIRIVVVGNIIQNGNPTDKQVGAYIDIPLIP
jgi:hypothetical protein